MRICFNFDGGYSVYENFDCFNSTLGDDIAERAEELADENGWEFVYSEISEWDADYADPRDFSDLNEYGEYAEAIEEHGEAFKLWYNNCNGCDAFYFENCYNGCWKSEKEFAEDLFANNLDGISDTIRYNIDWDGVVNDLHDYVFLWGRDGCHVYFNC